MATDPGASNPQLRRVNDALIAQGSKQGGNGNWRCPAHDDKHASLQVTTGDRQPVTIHCHAGCSPEAVLEALGLRWADVMPERQNGGRFEWAKARTYDYTDEEGKLLFQVGRSPLKDFRQRRPDGVGGWMYRLGDCRRVLYRLPQVLSAKELGQRIFLVEGEKDVEALEKAGEVATTMPGGVGKWRSEYTETLSGANVIIVRDLDSEEKKWAGQKHAAEVHAVLEGKAASIKIVEAKEGKDSADHLAAGYSADEFIEVADPWDFQRGLRVIAGGAVTEPKAPVIKQGQECGWCEPEGSELWIWTAQAKDTPPRRVPLLSADIVAFAVFYREGEQVFLVQIQDKTDLIELAGATLGDERALRRWLMKNGVNLILSKTNANCLYWTGIGPHLKAYLESQEPEQAEAIECLDLALMEPLGNELKLKKGYRVPAAVASWARWQLGLGDTTRAREVLSEVLTFHDPTVCAVFGAWWAACFLKDRILEQVSFFPFMALEAPSESGKSTGFFPLMLELNGRPGRGSVPTFAVARDEVSATRQGIFWIDDADHPDRYSELIRSATVEGELPKKGQDFTETVRRRLQAPIVMSGESLGLGGQKALRDRAVTLDVPSPKSRHSQRDPSRLQWADIISLRQAEPNLTKYAGSLALAVRELNLPDLVELAPLSGREGEKLSVLRLGAQALSDVVQDENWAQIVDAWCERVISRYSEYDNTAIRTILPAYLVSFGFPDTKGTYPHPQLGFNGLPATAAFIGEDGRIWVSVKNLARWWERDQRGRFDERTASEGAILAQLKNTKAEHKQRRLSEKGLPAREWKSKSWFWVLSERLSQRVREFAEGAND